MSGSLPKISTWAYAACHWILFSQSEIQWLRRRTRKPPCIVRMGSFPTGEIVFFNFSKKGFKNKILNKNSATKIESYGRRAKRVVILFFEKEQITTRK